MHLLKIEQSGDLYASGEAVDLNQSPAKMVILTAADSEISLLAEAASQSGYKANDLRLANILSLSHPFSIDLYIQNTLSHAQIIVVRLFRWDRVLALWGGTIITDGKTERHCACHDTGRWSP